MNLVIDFGNTRIKAGLFRGTELERSFPLSGIAEIAGLIDEMAPEKILISSVSNSREELQNILPAKVLYFSHEMPLPFTNAYKTPATLGLDRLAAVAGALELFPDRNVLVIDMGTCITYDLLTSQGVYSGGGISPGLMMRFRAIHEFTARLPLAEMEPSPQLIGQSTVSCIQSGVVNGLRAELNGIISDYASKYDRLKIIMCGGDMNYFENTLKQSIFAAPELVLRGLNRILLHNA